MFDQGTGGILSDPTKSEFIVAVNTAVTGAPRRRLADGAYNDAGGQAPESRENCALCTVAALSGRSSSDINLALQAGMPPAARWGPLETDEALVHWWQAHPGYLAPPAMPAALAALHEQIQGVQHFLQGVLGVARPQFGSATAQQPMAAAIAWMAARPVGARFAVYVNAIVFGSAHWVVGEHTAAGVHFIDYQMDTQGGHGVPAATALPTCGGDTTANPGATLVVIA